MLNVKHVNHHEVYCIFICENCGKRHENATQLKNHRKTCKIELTTAEKENVVNQNRKDLGLEIQYNAHSCKGFNCCFDDQNEKYHHPTCSCLKKNANQNANGGALVGAYPQQFLQNPYILQFLPTGQFVQQPQFGQYFHQQPAMMQPVQYPVVQPSMISPVMTPMMLSNPYANMPYYFPRYWNGIWLSKIFPFL